MTSEREQDAASTAPALLSGAVVSQVISGVVLWKLSRSEADAPATA